MLRHYKNEQSVWCFQCNNSALDGPAGFLTVMYLSNKVDAEKKIVLSNKQGTTEGRLGLCGEDDELVGEQW